MPIDLVVANASPLIALKIGLSISLRTVPMPSRPGSSCVNGWRAMQRSLQALCSYGGFELPGHDRHTRRQLFDDLVNVLRLVVPAGHKNRVMHRQRREALVDDPREGPDVGAHEILL